MAERDSSLIVRLSPSSTFPQAACKRVRQRSHAAVLASVETFLKVSYVVESSGCEIHHKKSFHCWNCQPSPNEVADQVFCGEIRCSRAASTSKLKRVPYHVRDTLRTNFDASDVVPFTVYVRAFFFLQASVCGVSSGIRVSAWLPSAGATAGGRGRGHGG